MQGNTVLVLAARAAVCALLFAWTQSSSAAASIVPPLSAQWAFSLGEDEGNLKQPLVESGRVYVTHRGVLRCLDNITGAELWKFSPENVAVTTAPVRWQNIVVVGATNATVYALDAGTGDPIWERICAAAIAPSPVLLEDVLLVGAGHMVYALSPQSGEATWICSLTAPVESGPVCDGGMAYFLCHGGSLQCVDAGQGRYRWTANLATGPRTFPLTVARRRVIVASGYRIQGVARSGAVAWTAEIPAGVGATPVLADDILYVPCVDGRIYTLYARSGAPRHHVIYQVDHPLTSSPAVSDTIVAAGSGDGLLYVFDAASGRVSWLYRCRGPDQLPNEAAVHGIYAPVVASDGSLYCLTGTGNLYRFTASAHDSGGPVFGDFEPEPGSAGPGGQYVAPVCSIADDGSGVDPSSVSALLDGSPLPVTFDLATGVATMRGAVLRDGPHIVKVTARDFRGNESSTEWSFLTDASILPEETAAGQSRVQPRGQIRR